MEPDRQFVLAHSRKWWRIWKQHGHPAHDHKLHGKDGRKRFPPLGAQGHARKGIADGKYTGQHDSQPETERGLTAHVHRVVGEADVGKDEEHGDQEDDLGSSRHGSPWVDGTHAM
jgi:hypothetical protein